MKVNPHGLRVGVIKDWDSKWYAEGDFADYLVEDYNLSLIHISASDDSTWIYDYNRCYRCHMCADTDFIEKKENIVIYCVFIKRPQYFIENNEILQLILF